MITTLIIYCLSVFTISWILTKEEVFRIPRTKIKNKALKYLVSCPYCISIYIAFILSWFWPLIAWHWGSLVGYAAVKIIGTLIVANEFTIED